MSKLKCIYCENELSLNYYLKHLKTKKHLNKKKKLIDDCLIFLPKDINNIIFEYFDDTPLEIQKYKGITMEMKRRERERIRIANIWYNKYPIKIKKFVHRLFHPYD